MAECQDFRDQAEAFGQHAREAVRSEDRPLPRSVENAESLPLPGFTGGVGGGRALQPFFVPFRLHSRGRALNIGAAASFRENCSRIAIRMAPVMRYARMWTITPSAQKNRAASWIALSLPSESVARFTNAMVAACATWRASHRLRSVQSCSTIRVASNPLRTRKWKGGLPNFR